MNLYARHIGKLGAAVLAVALSVVAPAQERTSSGRVKALLGMEIVQNLGASVPNDAIFRDETGKERSFGSLFKGRPLLVIPVPLRKKAGCGVVLDGLQKTLYRASHPNVRKVVKKEGENLLAVGKSFDIVVLSLDPRETPTDAAEAKNEFHRKMDENIEPATFLTGDLENIRKVTDAMGFKYLFDEKRNVLNNATGSVLLTPDGRASSYTIGKDFQTIELERNLEIAQAGNIGEKADDSQMLACTQLDATVLARRSKIESIYTAAAVVTLITVVLWILSMLRAERTRNQDLGGGQPNGA
jgi:protein SCO1